MLHEPQRAPLAVVGEHAPASAQHERIDHEPDAVDEVALEERADEGEAADDVQVVAVLALERVDRVRQIALEQRGVLPGERLLSVVEATYFGS